MDDDSAYDIGVASVDGEPVACEASLTRAVTEALRRHRIAAATISLALVDDQSIAILNERHLGHHGPTDVLTFDLRDERVPLNLSVQGPPGAPAPGITRALDGEIVMSIETAAREAGRLGHTVEAELALYAVHGTLHLLGYDDATPEDAERMHIVEDQILEAIGLGAVFGAGEQ